VGNSRKPDAWTPLNKAELADLRRQIKRKTTEELRHNFRITVEMCKLPYGMHGGLPRPFLIQELVQIWRELYRRMPKSRD